MSAMRPNEKRLGESPIGKLLFEFSLPAIVGMMVISMYSVVDRIFVGQVVGPLAISGISLTFPISLLMMACGMLVGIGAGASISIKLGQQKKDEAEEILGNAFMLLLIVAGLTTGLGLMFLGPLLSLFGAGEQTMAYGKQFISIIMAFSIFQFIGFGLNGSISASGSPKVSMMTMVINASLNIILLTIFIGVFRWGVRGSAVATVIAQGVSAIWVLVHLRGKNATLKLRFSQMRLRKRAVSMILGIGMGPFTLQLGSSLIILFLNRQLYLYGGDLAIGAMGAIFAVTMFLVMPIMGLSHGVQPIIGYNFGANNNDRVWRAFKLAVIVGSIHTMVVAVIIQCIPHALIQVFSKDPELVRIGTQGIRIYLLMIPFSGFLTLGANFFLAIGKPIQSMILNLSRQVLILLPLIFILPRFFGIRGVWMAVPISDGIALCFTTFLLVRQFATLKKTDAGETKSPVVEIDPKIEEPYSPLEASEYLI